MPTLEPGSLGWPTDTASAYSTGIIHHGQSWYRFEGFSRKDDTLPERQFTPLEGGALAGQSYPREEFEQALTALYALKGWDLERGVPTRERLVSLSLDWAVDLLAASHSC